MSDVTFDKNAISASETPATTSCFEDSISRTSSDKASTSSERVARESPRPVTVVDSGEIVSVTRVFIDVVVNVLAESSVAVAEAFRSSVTFP